MKFDEILEEIYKTPFGKSVREKELLREGLIYSYSSNTLKSDINRTFKDEILYTEEEPLLMGYVSRPELKNPNTVVFVFKQSFDNQKELQRILDRSGYIIVKQNLNSEFDKQPAKLFQVEPKFPVVMKFPMNKIRMFHITERSSLDKIKKIGLCPKTSKTTFNHSGNRIYLFITNDPEVYIPKLSEMLARDKNKRVEDMVALEVSPNFSTSEEYFLDMSFVQIKKSCYAVFTFNSIPVSHIKETNY